MRVSSDTLIKNLDSIARNYPFGNPCSATIIMCGTVRGNDMWEWEKDMKVNCMYPSNAK